MGFEPMNTGFADQRVSHFATGAHSCLLQATAYNILKIENPPGNIASGGF